MPSARLASLAASPAFVALALAALFIALGDAVAGPYLALFAVEKVKLAPFGVGLFVSMRAASSILMSTLLGHWLDRRRTVVPLFLALAMGLAAYCVLTATTDAVLVLVVAAIPLGMSSASFSQVFAIAKGHLDRADGRLAHQGLTLIRAVWSVAWAFGPMVGALAIGAFDFTGVFLGSAGCIAAAGLILAASRLRPDDMERPPDARDAAGGRRAVALAVASFTCFFSAMFMGSVALPIVVTQDLSGSKGDVGAIYSLCAFLEVPVMLSIALWPRLYAGLRGLGAGFLAFALYFAICAAAHSVGAMLWAQAVRAVAIGIVTSVGLGHMQRLMPGRAGVAAALFTNCSQIGFLTAGVGAGTLAQAFGYRSLFLACTAVSLAGLALLPGARGRADT